MTKLRWVTGDLSRKSVPNNCRASGMTAAHCPPDGSASAPSTNLLNSSRTAL
jgi:hypothetical protein